jgi:hypothetical protein
MVEEGTMYGDTTGEAQACRVMSCGRTKRDSRRHHCWNIGNQRAGLAVDSR